MLHWMRNSFDAAPLTDGLPLALSLLVQQKEKMTVVDGYPQLQVYHQWLECHWQEVQSQC